MKTAFLSLIFLSLILSCCEQVATVNDESKSDTNEFEYTLINDDLYQDESGQLFFRVIDRSAADNPANPEQGVQVDYIDYLRFDTLINGKETYITPLIDDIIDANTFREIEVPERLDYRVFEDKNYEYILWSVADGGVLHVVK